MLPSFPCHLRLQFGNTIATEQYRELLKREARTIAAETARGAEHAATAAAMTPTPPRINRARRSRPTSASAIGRGMDTAAGQAQAAALNQPLPGSRDCRRRPLIEATGGDGFYRRAGWADLDAVAREDMIGSPRPWATAR